MNDQHVCLMLLTYKRTDYAVTTLESIRKNLQYEGPFSIHIADDGSDQSHRDAVLKIAKDFDCEVTITNSERRGYGANYNLATQVVHQRADYVLCVEDDWECIRPLVLMDYIPALKRFGCVRLGYIGFTQEARGTLHYVNNSIWFRFYENSREPHVWAGHPRIETVEWQRSVGPWPELLEPGHTEYQVAIKPAARLGVVWPMQFIPPSGNLFAHIGTERSY